MVGERGKKVRGRVLVLSSSFPRFEGDPAGNFVKEQALYLIKEGFEVKVIVPPWIGRREGDGGSGLEVIPFPSDRAGIVRRVSYGSGTLNNILKKPLLLSGLPLYLSSSVFTALRYRDWFDLILSQWALPMGLCAAIVRGFTGKGHINILHGGDVRLLSFLPGGRAIASLISAGTDRFGFTSHYIGREFEKLVHGKGGVKTFYSPLGVSRMGGVADGERRRWREGLGIEGRFVVLYSGRLEAGKGVGLLIDALKGIEGVSLIVAGDGLLRTRLMERAERGGIHALFTGPVPLEDKRVLLDLCHLTVLPSSPSSPLEGEGLPVAILESFAGGRPVVAARVGGIPEVVRPRENGLLYHPSDRNSLRDCIILLMKERRLLKWMGEGARRAGRAFQWENSGPHLVRAMKEVMEGGRGR